MKPVTIQQARFKKRLEHLWWIVDLGVSLSRWVNRPTISIRTVTTVLHDRTLNTY